MLLEAGLPTRLWGEAALTACYLSNRTPRQYSEQVATPEEKWTDRKPDLSHLKVFGCVAYAQLAKEQRDKLDPTSIRGVFTGYTPTTRQYRVYNPETGIVERYSIVRFDENRKGGTLIITGGSDQDKVTLKAAEEEQTIQDNPLPEGDTIVVRGRTPEFQGDSGSETTLLSRPPSQPPSERPRDASEAPTERQTRSGRTIRIPGRYQAQQVTAEIATPTTYDEAITGPQKRQWEAAIAEELSSLVSNDVWTLVQRPRDTNIVSCKWVFKIKRLPNGQIDKFKARLVARGFTQQYGVDYEETFAPVVRMESLRILLAIATQEDLEVHQMDVVTAYLAGELEEEIYMTAPQGIPEANGKVCQLRKGLYGLKQSARVWNRRISTELGQAGLEAITADQSIWINKDASLILALYVDDLVLLAREMQELRWIKGFLAQQFKMKDLGPISTMLGMRVRRDRANQMFWIDQIHYIKDLLKEFQYTNCRPVSTPADGYEHIEPAKPHDTLFADVAKYQRALGQLNWLVRGTRPDLAFVVHKLSQYCHQPHQKHWTGVQRVFKYLKHSQDLALSYRANEDSLVGYSDTDYAADTADRRSTMGYAYILSGAAVTWASRKQQSIATSTTEAEYIGLCNASKEAVWIRNLLKHLRRSEYAGETQATRILGDNQSSLKLVTNPEFHSRSKHIDVQYHYTRELVEDGIVEIDYIPTTEMAADCLTKPLKRRKLEVNLEALGLIRV
jgi:hypothetical protein